jgi:basic amino acid/polyamine antiporter, APA family
LEKRMTDQDTTPKRLLSLTEGLALTVGIVIGAGIFKTPSLVAASTGSVSLFMAAWFVGALVSFAGGLCYAELTTTFSGPGGDYHYLYRAFGRRLAFLFAWARMTVIQPGSIAMLSFVIGDYLVQLFPLYPYGSSLYAAGLITVLTLLNLTGIRRGARTQTILTMLKILGILMVIGAGLLSSPAPPSSPLAGREVTFGLAMVFVLLTFGGWNEAAYLSAEMTDLRRNMIRVFLAAIAIITAIYVLVCLAYLKGLGLSGMSGSEAVAADLMRRTLGEGGAKFVSLLVALSALGSVNAMIITGARTNYALGVDFAPFRFIGRWDVQANTPRRALIVQGGVSLALVLFGTLGRKGFVAMVDYTAPVFWFFFFLAGISLIILRVADPVAVRPFRVPLYPVIPLFFCGACLYMLWSSLAYTGIGSLIGVSVLLAGALVLIFTEGKEDAGRGL